MRTLSDFAHIATLPFTWVRVCGVALCHRIDAPRRTVQHLGELTFFVTLLHAIAARHGAVAAAETLYSATAAIRSALVARLGALAHAPPARGAVEYFTLLAQTRELLSRSKELVQTLVGADVRRVFLARISAQQDEVMLNHTQSDRGVRFLRTLSLSAVIASPLLHNFLQGPCANTLPAEERTRLALPRPVTHASAWRAQQPLSVRVRCGAVVPIPLDLLRPLTRLVELADLFARWQAQASRAAPPPPAPPVASAGQHQLPPRTHHAVPLPVDAYVLRTILDCAFGVVMEPKVGGPAAKVQYLQGWAAELHGNQPLKAAVYEFAELLGFSECVAMLNGTVDSHRMCTLHSP
jgi:hypothetical protein